MPSPTAMQLALLEALLAEVPKSWGFRKPKNITKAECAEMIGRILDRKRLARWKQSRGYAEKRSQRYHRIGVTHEWSYRLI